MPDANERLLAAATRPLADNAELRMAARHELMESIAGGAAEGADSLETLAARLEERAGEGAAGRSLRFVCLGLLAVLSLVAVVDVARSARLWLWTEHYSRVMWAPMSGGGPFSKPFYLPSYEAVMAGHLSEEERFLLLGDVTKPVRSEQLKALWESEPENPAYFEDYASSYSIEHDALPPDYPETSARIDPDNGWPLLRMAARCAGEAIDTGAREITSLGGARYRPVKDPQKLEETIALLGEVVRKPEFRRHRMDLANRRVPLFPRQDDVMERFIPFSHLSLVYSSDMFRLRRLSEAVAARAISLAEAGEAGEVRALVNDWEVFSQRYVEIQNPVPIDMWIGIVTISHPLRALREAAEAAGLEEEANRMGVLNERFKERRDVLQARYKAEGGNGDSRPYRSGMVGKTVLSVEKQSLHWPGVDEADLKPGRLAEHGVFGRVASLAGWLLLGMSLLAAWSYRYRSGPMHRRLSRVMAASLRPVDWAWIAGVSVLLPLGFYHGVQRLTPASAREWGLDVTFFIDASGQSRALLLLMIVLPVLIVRWRLALRAGAVGLSSPWKWWMAAVVPGAMALPVFGLAFGEEGRNEAAMWTAAGLGGILLAMWLVMGVRALFGRSGNALRRVTISRILVPVYAAGMFAMALSVPLHHAEERYWVGKDWMMKLSTEVPAARYEAEVAKAIRGELRDLLRAE